MQITMGAQCWDGLRRKSLNERISVIEPVTVTETPVPKISRLKDPVVGAILGFSVPIMMVMNNWNHRAFADDAIPAMAMSADAKGKILHAFDPLINLIQSLAYPIAGVMIVGGCLFIMVGNRERGMDMLKNAAMGYILVQLAPFFLDLLVGIGKGV